MGKLADYALNFVSDHKLVRQQLKQRQSILLGIQSVQNDTERKQIKDEGIKNWFDALQDLSYDVDDILDEFAYEASCLKLKPAPVSYGNLFLLALLVVVSLLTLFMFNNSMIPKMKEVTARLNDLTARITNLGSSEITSQASSSKGKNPRLQPTYVVEFTSSQVEGEVIWKKTLDRFRYIWNDSYNDWSMGRSPFGAETKIIVTTCLLNVASIVDAVKSFVLDKLSHDGCVSIFTQHALKARNFNGNFELKEVAENIVRRCDGLPLTAKAIRNLTSVVFL